MEIMPLALFFLFIAFLIGCTAAFYVFILQRLKDRRISYIIPPIIIALWVLLVSSQEMSGPALTAINFMFMFLYYPLIVVSFLPLANTFVKLDRGWAVAMAVATLVIFTLLLYGGLEGEKIAMLHEPLSYMDNLARNIFSLIDTAFYVIIGYAVVVGAIWAIKALTHKKV